MAAIAVSPFVSKDYKITIGADNYEAHFSAAQLVPASAVVTWQGLTPTAAFSEPGSETWTFVIAYAQDWVTANGLSDYLHANKGTRQTVTVQPRGVGTGKPTFTFDVFIAAGPVGGTVNTVAEGSVTMGVVGVPAKTVQV